MEALMRNVRNTLVLLFAVGLGACSDGALAPKAEQGIIMGGGVTADLSQNDTTRFPITVDPSKNMGFYLGAGNTVKFPAGSICDPSSSYGEDQWDQPCAPLTQPITINVKAWLDSQGNPRTDFDRHIRFVPSDDPSRWVVIEFTAPDAATSDSAAILYCATAVAGCEEEAASDPTLATFRDPVSGKLQRRIKHFSGYNVFAGRGCDGLDCIVPGDAVLWNKIGSTLSSVKPVETLATVKTGFMLAWA
jgi:hypothetical protein